MSGFDLDAARAAFPLPDHIEDAVLNLAQCAEALGVSKNMVSTYLGQGMPVLTQGTNGQAYEFSLADVYAWKMSRDDEQKRRREAGDRAAAQLSLLFRGEDPDDVDAKPVLSAEDIIKESKADYEWNKARELRRELVRADRVRELFELMLVEVRTNIVTLVDFCELEFGLTPDQVRKIEARCDAALISMRAGFGQVCEAEVVHLPDHTPIGAEAQDG